MTELEQAIAEILDYPSVFMGGPSRLSMRKAEAIVAMLNERIATGQLVPAQVWQDWRNFRYDEWDQTPAEILACRRDGEFELVSGANMLTDEGRWFTHWMPLPPPPAEGV